MDRNATAALNRGFGIIPPPDELAGIDCTLGSALTAKVRLHLVTRQDRAANPCYAPAHTGLAKLTAEAANERLLPRYITLTQAVRRRLISRGLAKPVMRMGRVR